MLFIPDSHLKYNVNEYLKSNYSGAEAIEWAMKSGHTTKTGDVSGGLGLDIIFEFIKLNKGRIQIVSSDGYWEYYNDKMEKKLFANPFHGTIANIEFNLNDKSLYHLKEEIPLEDIF
jgi:CTP-dependent riboflavin kinase